MRVAALALAVALSHPHVANVVHAFQPQGSLLRPSSPYHARRRLFERRGQRVNVVTSAGEGDAPPDDRLEKFAAPLELKTGGDGTSTGAKSDASSPTTGKVVASSDKAVDMSTFTPSADTPLANKYYMLKMQTAGGSTDATAETAETPPPTPTRRRFTDFGIASERAEPINGEASVQDSAASASEDSAPPIKLNGFTDLGGRGARPMKVNIEGGSSPNKAADAKPPAPAGETAQATSSGDAQQSAASGVNEAPPAAAAKEKNVAPAASSDAAKKEASATTAPTKDTTTPAATASELVKSQPTTTTNPLSLPSMNLDVEDYGLVPLVIIGVSLFSALGIFLNQNDDSKSKDAGNEKGTDESKNLLQKVKDAGPAGAVSYALWEAAFWGVSIPVCVVSYQKVTGHWPNLSDAEEVKQVGLEAFAFVNVARLAVPLRIGLALSTVPWVEENIMRRFKGSDSGSSGEEAEQLYEETKASTAFDGVQPTRAKETISQSQPTTPEYTSDRRRDESTSAISSEDELEFCEPGQITEGCSESIKGYLDSLASTGAVATDGEVKAIVGYLDSLGSNASPAKKGKAGAAFTSYLDALSEGYMPAPTSAEAVADYLGALTNGNDVAASSTGQTEEERIGSRIIEVEVRLDRLERSVDSLPDDIASRLLDYQARQDQKLSDEMEKIMALLVARQ
ncbi:hypothetical protein ACHAXT_006402 [Thalassiosira profunda]